MIMLLLCFLSIILLHPVMHNLYLWGVRDKLRILYNNCNKKINTYEKSLIWFLWIDNSVIRLL